MLLYMDKVCKVKSLRVHQNENSDPFFLAQNTNYIKQNTQAALFHTIKMNGNMTVSGPHSLSLYGGKNSLDILLNILFCVPCKKESIQDMRLSKSQYNRCQNYLSFLSP